MKMLSTKTNSKCSSKILQSVHLSTWTAVNSKRWSMKTNAREKGAAQRIRIADSSAAVERANLEIRKWYAREEAQAL
jgi:hypothetical protein